MVNATTGAVVAAPTTSLPESVGHGRNWDYRYSWVRDSQFTVRSLTQLGCIEEADGFRRLIERSAADSAESLLRRGVRYRRRAPARQLPPGPVPPVPHRRGLGSERPAPGMSEHH